MKPLLYLAALGFPALALVGLPPAATRGEEKKPPTPRSAPSNAKTRASTS